MLSKSIRYLSMGVWCVLVLIGAVFFIISVVFLGGAQVIGEWANDNTD